MNQIKRILEIKNDVIANNLIERWKESKSELIPYFNEEGKIKVTNNDFKLAVTVEDINNVWGEALYRSIVNNNYEKEDIFTIKDAFKYMTNTFTIDEIVTNKTKSNVKLTKVLRKHLEEIEVGSKLIDSIITIYSSIGNTFSAVSEDVEIYLSINPIDFITMSANTTNWTSCHNYITGSYKAGCVSHMLDEVSVIAYALNKEGLKLWRQVVYIIPNDKAMFSRQYPNTKPTLHSVIRNSVSSIFFETTLLLESNKVDMYNNGYGYLDNIDYELTLNPLFKVCNLVNFGSAYRCPICGRYNKVNKYIFPCTCKEYATVEEAKFNTIPLIDKDSGWLNLEHNGDYTDRDTGEVVIFRADYHDDNADLTDEDIESYNRHLQREAEREAEQDQWRNDTNDDDALPF